MNFIPYKANEYLENIFYQIPKELFINPYYKNNYSNIPLIRNSNYEQRVYEPEELDTLYCNVYTKNEKENLNYEK